jgi:hypothetical protein
VVRCAVCSLTLASGQAAPLRIAVDHTSVYWVNTGDGRGAFMKIAR